MVPFCVIGDFNDVDNLRINMAHEQTQARYWLEHINMYFDENQAEIFWVIADISGP